MVNTPAARRSIDLGNAVTESLKNHLDESKPKGGCQMLQLNAYKHLKGTITTKPLSVTRKSWNTVMKYFKVRQVGLLQSRNDWWHLKQRKLRKDKLSPEITESVKDFFLAPEISREVPAKAEAIKMKDNNGEVSLVAKHTMTMTMEEAFQQYKQVFPEHKIGISSFKYLKPSNIRKESETSCRTCLCTTCCNLALKIEAINKSVQAILKDAAENDDAELPENLSSLLMKLNKAAISDAVLFPYDVLPNKACLDRSCQMCATILDDVLAPLKDYKQSFGIIGNTYRSSRMESRRRLCHVSRNKPP